MDGGIIISNEIYKILENEILNLKLKPGISLSEKGLRARFNVSRTPIRGVMQKLETKGLITMTPYMGAIVTLLDFDIINQIIYQRVAVESMILRDFMKICTPMLIERVRHLVRSSRVLIEDKFDARKFFLLDSNLHEVWFAEMKKLYLWNAFQNAQSSYSRFRLLDIAEMHNYEEIVKEQERLLDILVKKDFDAVEPWFIQHLYGGITRLGDRVYTEFKDYFLHHTCEK
ncbi:MAG: GntR family transcriptional regulator [Clostridiales bacterium]|jgi:DNA-binding GntR family transcriptional regulator|nr:GntR family transcriptional regulator [Clostridiales bacterium]